MQGIFIPVAYAKAGGQTSWQCPQHAFYDKLQELEIFKSAEWLAVIDVDEFINIHIGSCRLDDLISSAGEADVIQLNWAVFGDNGQRSFSEMPVIQRFTKRIKEKHRINAGCKCLVKQPQRFERLRNHNPARFKGPQSNISVFSGSGETRDLVRDTNLNEALQYTSTEAVCFKVAQINHYATKSWPEYELRQIRGNGAIAATQKGRQRYDDRYFSLRAQADISDVSILRHAQRLEDEIEFLTALPMVEDAMRIAIERLHYRIAKVSESASSDGEPNQRI